MLAAAAPRGRGCSVTVPERSRARLPRVSVRLRKARERIASMEASPLSRLVAWALLGRDRGARPGRRRARRSSACAATRSRPTAGSRELLLTGLGGGAALLFAASAGSSPAPSRATRSAGSSSARPRCSRRSSPRSATSTSLCSATSRWPAAGGSSGSAAGPSSRPSSSPRLSSRSSSPTAGRCPGRWRWVLWITVAIAVDVGARERARPERDSIRSRRATNPLGVPTRSATSSRTLDDASGAVLAPPVFARLAGRARRALPPLARGRAAADEVARVRRRRAGRRLLALVRHRARSSATGCSST